MKLLFNASLGVALTFSICMACSDSNDLVENSIPNDQPISYRTNDNPQYHYYDNGLPDGDPFLSYGCVTPAINCAAEFTVGPECINTIFTNIHFWSAGQLQSFVNANSTDIASVIGSGETAGLISGAYTLRVRGTTSAGFLIVRSGSSIISVTPVVK